jgi:hypothetical protein
MNQHPTDTHLAVAYRRLHKPGWPELADALADPVRGRCIRLMAGALAAGRIEPATGRRAPGAAATLHTLALPPLPAWDAKRAAAGDIERDDTFTPRPAGRPATPDHPRA